MTVKQLQDGDLSFWVVTFVPERADFTYNLGLFLTKTEAKIGAVKEIVRIVGETVEIWKEFGEEVDSETLQKYFAHFDKGEYDQIIDHYQTVWCDHMDEIRFEEMKVRV